MKYSIIIPVYNSEKYLKACLESVVNQVYTDYEVVVWDDGSTDHTADIMEEYENNDRCVLFHDINCGAGVARKKAVQKAKGKYLLFLDSDDIINSNLLDTIDCYITPDTDLLQFGSKTFWDTPKIERPYVDRIVRYEREDFINKVVRTTIVDGKEAVVLWDKVYRRDVFLNLQWAFPYQLLEDYVFNMEYYSKVRQYVRIDATLYYYRYTASSLSRKPPQDWFDILKRVDCIKSEFMQENTLTTEADVISASNWLLRYIENIMIRSYSVGAISKEGIVQIVTDPVIVERALLAVENHFADHIKKGNKGALLYIQRKSVVFRLRQMLKKILAKFR
ncbi:MAG: glycosyltransferase [Bacteroides thetaiotaomicron]|nr:glycosyltransferase [Bacteroides thetaiotaomicron]